MILVQLNFTAEASDCKCWRTRFLPTYKGMRSRAKGEEESQEPKSAGMKSLTPAEAAALERVICSSALVPAKVVMKASMLVRAEA